MSMAAASTVGVDVEESTLPPTAMPIEQQMVALQKKSLAARDWKKIMLRALVLGLIVGVIMAGVSVISSYIAVGEAPTWRNVAASSFTSFILTAVLTFVLNFI